MSDVIIQVEKLSKQYRLGEVSTGSLGHDLNRWWHRVRGKEDPYLKVTQTNIREQGSTAGTDSASADYVWALREVEFEVERGEVLGIIGRNGAGKSTLLKILARITAPTLGEVRLDGRVGALLEVGTGFHPDLTGRENIFLNGAILGMSRSEIRKKLDEIVDFSGCARYLDTPVKRYSSGMVVRLGFAVAAHLDPEILIVDEVLAVGDFAFQAKCLGKMSEVASAGRTVLFVSHNLASIQNLCPMSIWLENGSIAMGKEDSVKVVCAYEQSGRTESGVLAIAPAQHKVRSAFQIQRIEILDRTGRPSPALKYGEPVRLRLICLCTETLAGVEVGIVLRANGLPLTTLRTENHRFEASDQPYRLDCVIPGGVLLPGLFELDAGASQVPGRVGLDYIRGVGSFAVSDVGVDADWIYDRRHQGMVDLPAEWQLAGTEPDVPKAGHT